MTFYVGVDGGGTKTACVVLDEQRQVRGRGRAGSSNWNSVGFDQAHQHLEQAVHDALAAAGADGAQVAAICLGMSGVDRPDDRVRLGGWMGKLLPAANVLIHNDAVIALASGTGGSLYGSVLVCGTGMIAYGFDAAGRHSRAGGWGALLGDGGSGYAIGAAVLRAATWAADGRGPETALLPALLEHLHLQQAQQLVRWAYDDVSWQRFAHLAPLAMAWAERGDPLARQILAQAAEDLAVAAEAVARALQMQEETAPLVLAGHLLQPGILADRLVVELSRRLPRAQVTSPLVEAELAAALLAAAVGQH